MGTFAPGRRPPEKEGLELPSDEVVDMDLLSYSVEENVDRTPAEVFDFCSDLTNEARWNPDMEHVEKVTDGPVGVGTRFEAKWTRTRPVVVEVVGFDRPEKWETRSKSGGLEITVRGTLSEAGGGTRIQTHLAVRAKGLARLYAPLAVLAMRRGEPGNLRAIKKVLEATSSSDPMR
ncbi:MAG: SRPBCC family protein [Acidimicrobiia bacterium]